MWLVLCRPSSLLRPWNTMYKLCYFYSVSITNKCEVTLSSKIWYEHVLKLIKKAMSLKFDTFLVGWGIWLE